MSSTRSLILEAACGLLNEGGLDDVKIREVAAAADVGRSTVIHHFGSKGGLLDALYLVALEALSSHVRDANFIPTFLPETKEKRRDIQKLLNFSPDPSQPRELSMAIFSRFRSDKPGFWEILRARQCPKFSAAEAPAAWALLHGIAGSELEAPLGPTVDLLVHQILALHDWLAAASPEAVIRVSQSNPSLPYWGAVFGTMGS